MNRQSVVESAASIAAAAKRFSRRLTMVPPEGRGSGAASHTANAAVPATDLAPQTAAPPELIPCVTNDADAQALRTFLESGNPLALAEAYTAARLRELRTEPALTLRNIWRAIRGRSMVPRPTSKQITATVESATVLMHSAAELVDAQNKLATKLITLHTTQQRFQLEQEKHTTAIAEQRHRTARAQDETRRLAKRSHGTPAAQEHTTPLPEVVEQIVARELERRAGDAAAATKHTADQRRAEEEAEAKHRTLLSGEAVKQALNEGRIRGLSNPHAARRARAARHADREARAFEDWIWQASEVVRKSERNLRRLKKRHGDDSDVYQHALNKHSILVTRLATDEGEHE
jgi:hypothetical protein